jgi:hypothetical protein
MVLYEIYSPYMEAYTTSVDWSGLVIFRFPFGSPTSRMRLAPFPMLYQGGD